MNFVKTTRRMLTAAVAGAVFVATFGSTAALTSCGDTATCNKVRNDTFAEKEKWSTCDPDLDLIDPQCIKVFGNSHDCSGALFCDFAVNKNSRLAAEQAVLTIANQTQGCYLCAQPNCVMGEVAICESASKQCIIVSAVQTTTSPSDASINILDVGIPPILLGDGATE